MRCRAPSKGEGFSVVLRAVLSLSAALVNAQPSQPAAATAAEGALHVVGKNPSATTIYIDGALLAGTAAKLSAGTHQLVAVAPGYYGQSRDIGINTGQDRGVHVILQPTSLPTPVDVERFLVLADSKTISAADVQGMPEHTLRVALHAKLLNQQGQTHALQQLREALAALVAKEDTRGAVTAFLVDAIVSGTLDQPGISGSLLAASHQNDPMASFFYAMSLREGLSKAGTITPSSPQFTGYCEALRRAQSQGWKAVATIWQQRDSCPE
jgi:hypothetical protein